MQNDSVNLEKIQQLTLAESFIEMALAQSTGNEDWSNFSNAESDGLTNCDWLSDKQLGCKPTLEQLVAQCDMNAPLPDDLIEWENMPSVGNEILDDPIDGTNCDSI